MNELFRMMTVRAPQVTTDPNVVTIGPKSFKAPAPPAPPLDDLGKQLAAFLLRNEYKTILDLDFSRWGTTPLTLFPGVPTLVPQTSGPDQVTLAKKADPNSFTASIQPPFGKSALQVAKPKAFATLRNALAADVASRWCS